MHMETSSRYNLESLMNVDESTECTISKCCLSTVDELAANNEMMVCTGCKRIIKTYSKKKTFSNYVKFCSGRNRAIETGWSEGRWIVVFHSYDT